MARAALRIEVATKDRKELRKLLGGGVQQVRVVLRAIALLQLAKGVSAPRIAGMVPLTPQAIRKIGHRYRPASPPNRLQMLGVAYVIRVDLRGKKASRYYPTRVIIAH